MDDFAIVDEFVKDASPEVRAAWARVSRAARRGQRISSATLPKIGGMAQRIVQVRDILNNVIEEMSDAVTPGPGEGSKDG